MKRPTSAQSLLALSWERAWGDLGLSPAQGLFEALVEAYAEPQRAYHTLQHLEECLAHFSASREIAHRPGEIEVALWFHDAIYDLQSHENEVKSADWAARALAEARADEATQRRVQQLVLATIHDAAPTDADQQLLVDIDLSILGAAEARFEEYGRQIRVEYSWVPLEFYTQRRREVLLGFLERKPIYNTAYFRDLLEQQARVNLEAATR